MLSSHRHWPRFLTDQELRAFFGLPGRALSCLRLTRGFPNKDLLVGKTDRNAVDAFFDRRARLVERSPLVSDGEEDWSGG